MKRPGILVFLFGNPISVVVLAIAAVYCGYEWWNGQIAPAVAVAVMIPAVYAGSARERYEKYRLWKLEWNAMEGRAPARRTSRLFRRGGPLHIAAGLFVWALCGYFIIAGSGQPGMQIPVTFFWIATVVMIAAAIYRLLRRRKSRRQSSRDVFVTVCIPVPRQSSIVAQTFAELPDYCSLIFQKVGGNSSVQS